MPSDIQAKEKLAHYVYEYLMHLGAKQSAQTFLQEIRWDKNVSMGEAPGFLSSWWCVFWDLYCAAPERRNQYEASDEAKVFHDYSNQAQNSNPHMVPGQPQFARFHPGQRGMRMPSNIDYNAVNNPNNSANTNTPNSSAPISNNNPNSNPQMNIDPNRVPSGLSPMNRLTPPGSRGMPINNQQTASQQNVNNIGFNGPNQPSSQQIRGPNPNQPINNAPMSPMPMNIQQQQQQHAARWANPPNQNTSGPPNQNPSQPPTPSANLNYGPGAPVIPSPQEDEMNLNKMAPSGIQFHDQNLNNMVPNINTEISHHNQINGEIMDSIKNSPISNLPNRHHDDHSNTGGPIADINPYNSFPDANLF